MKCHQKVHGCVELNSACVQERWSRWRKAGRGVDYFKCCLQTYNVLTSGTEILLDFWGGGQGETLQVHLRCNLPQYASRQQRNSTKCETPVKWSNDGLLWICAARFYSGSLSGLDSMLQCRRELGDATERKTFIKVLRVMGNKERAMEGRCSR